MTVIILGNFSGQAFLGKPSLPSEHRVMKVEVDTLDRLLERLEPSITVQLDTEVESFTIQFRCLDDFHPDELMKHLASVSTSILETNTEDLPSKVPQGQQKKPTDRPATESEQQTLQRLLGKAPLVDEKRRAERGGVGTAKQAQISEAVRLLSESSLASAPPPAAISPTAEHIDADKSSLLMRTLLHSAPFRTLEASWRSVDWLLRTVETDEAINIYLLDISRQALSADLAQSQGIEYTRIYEKLVETLPAEGTTLLLGNFTFSDTPGDIQLLSALGSLAGMLRGKFIATADSNMLSELGPDEATHSVQLTDEASVLSNAWQELRATKAAERIILALPRVLLRLPYGNRTDPVDSFQFEEMADGRRQEQLLWGNPAFACAILMLQQRQATDLETPTIIADMPAYHYREQGESLLQPCVEVMFNESEIDQFLKYGLVPILGSHNRASIQIPWLQSLAI